MVKNFPKVIWDHYAHNKRMLPWREIEELSIKDRGYRVLISEVMLQQTQVKRVVEKYLQWLERWPTIDSFANSSLSDVLVMWSGLGYNRRAKYLRDTLLDIQKNYKGIIPQDAKVLQSFPGIGPNTAAAIIVYTYNKPIAFIETNIRTVYLYSFFANTTEQVTDRQIVTLVTDTIDTENPRDWFYAIMDYGAYIKKNHGNQLHNARSHKKQSVFKGSKRQVRGKILQLLTQMHYVTADELDAEIADDRVHEVLHDLLSEGMITRHANGTYALPNR